MKKYILAGILGLFSVNTLADLTVDPNINSNVEITCTLPVEREDGTPLAVGEIATINFHAGTTSGNYTDTITRAVCNLSVDATALADQSFYYVATVVDTEGRESMYSAEFVLTVQRVKPPKPPTWN